MAVRAAYVQLQPVVANPAASLVPVIIVADTEAELPSSGLTEGSQVYCKDTKRWFSRTATAWEQVAESNMGVVKGDLITGDGTAMARLMVGANDLVLTADSTQTLGIKWATVGAASHPGFVTHAKWQDF